MKKVSIDEMLMSMQGDPADTRVDKESTWKITRPVGAMMSGTTPMATPSPIRVSIPHWLMVEVSLLRKVESLLPNLENHGQATTSATKTSADTKVAWNQQLTLQHHHILSLQSRRLLLREQLVQLVGGRLQMQQRTMRS